MLLLGFGAQGGGDDDYDDHDNNDLNDDNDDSDGDEPVVECWIEGQGAEVVEWRRWNSSR